METQTSICEWATHTFGTSKSALILAARAHKEASELYEVVACVQAQEGLYGLGQFEKFKGELADVMVVLYQVANFQGIGLSSASRNVSSKLGIGTLEELARTILKEFLQLFYWLSVKDVDDEYVLSCINDIEYLLTVMAQVYGLKLSDLVDDKMKVNRNRKWKITGSGIGQHE